MKRLLSYMAITVEEETGDWDMLVELTQSNIVARLDLASRFCFSLTSKDHLRRYGTELLHGTKEMYATAAHPHFLRFLKWPRLLASDLAFALIKHGTWHQEGRLVEAIGSKRFHRECSTDTPDPKDLAYTFLRQAFWRAWDIEGLCWLLMVLDMPVYKCQHLAHALLTDVQKFSVTTKVDFLVYLQGYQKLLLLTPLKPRWWKQDYLLDFFFSWLNEAHASEFLRCPEAHEFFVWCQMHPEDPMVKRLPFSVSDMPTATPEEMAETDRRSMPPPPPRPSSQVQMVEPLPLPEPDPFEHLPPPSKGHVYDFRPAPATQYQLDMMKMAAELDGRDADHLVYLNSFPQFEKRQRKPVRYDYNEDREDMEVIELDTATIICSRCAKPFPFAAKTKGRRCPDCIKEVDREYRQRHKEKRTIPTPLFQQSPDTRYLYVEHETPVTSYQEEAMRQAAHIDGWDQYFDSVYYLNFVPKSAKRERKQHVFHF